MSKLIIFILTLIIGHLYWRTLFYIAPHVLKEPFTRTKTGLQVHHMHYGILFVLVASVTLLLNGESIFVVVLLGLGLGLMLDEFIPSLLLAGDRQLELEVYRKSFSKTVYLFLIIILVIFLLGFLNNMF